MFDPDLAMQQARAMQTARELTGRVCSEDEEQEASEQFMAWAQSMGVRGSFMRTVADDGRMIWKLHINTGRGRLSAVIVDPRVWRQGVIEMGLGDSLDA